MRGVRSSWPASETSCACCCREERNTGEHGVEGACQAGQLVVSLLVDRRVELLGNRNTLGRRGELLDGANRRPGHGVAETDSESDAGEDDKDQDQPQVCERVPQVAQWMEYLRRYTHPASRG